MAQPYDKALTAVTKAARRYQKTEKAHGDAREALIAAALKALMLNAPPTVVAKEAGLSDTYLRKVAREAGIPPAIGPRIKPGRRTIR